VTETGSRRLGVAAALILALLASTFAPAPRSLARFTDATATTGGIALDTLEPPTGLSATGGADVTLTWTPTVDAYATGYDVLRSATTGGPYSTAGTVTPGSATSTVDSPGDGTWYYVLRSTYGPWSSTDSNEASASVASSVSTDFVSCVPGSNAADTVAAGDNDGFQSNPDRACTDDGINAMDSRSGTGGTQSCGSGATPDVRKDRHRFWGFATGSPATVTSIDGIEVRADIGLNNNAGSTNVCIQLSWDAGTTWTSMQAATIKAIALNTYTYGSPSDTWGRSWTAGELDPANFQVRVVNASTMANKQVRLDYLAIRVTYTP
jgi:hypothetical protein